MNKLSFVSSFMLVVVTLIHADEVAGTPYEKVVAQIQAVTERNFQACTEQDEQALAETLSPSLPAADRAEFIRVAKGMWEEGATYYRLEQFKPLHVTPTVATAIVVQTMLPSEDVQYTEERVSYGLMSEHKTVKYVQTYRKENGRWRLHLGLAPIVPCSPDEPLVAP